MKEAIKTTVIPLARGVSRVCTNGIHNVNGFAVLFAGSPLLIFASQIAGMTFGGEVGS